MGQINLEGLGAVQETLIIPLAMRALDLKSKRPILGDERAARLYEEITYSDKKFAPKKSPSYYGCLKRAGYMDGELIRYARELHAQGKPFVTVNAGCGLDTRGERIAGATYGATHYDVDFPNVIELRQRLLGESATALGSDLLEGDWLARLASEITPRRRSSSRSKGSSPTSPRSDPALA
ncbi:MAG: class I SAM-dependent methyltransferase [Porphyromonas pasteri]